MREQYRNHPNHRDYGRFMVPDEPQNWLSIPEFCGVKLFEANWGGDGSLVLHCSQEKDHDSDHLFTITMNDATIIFKLKREQE